MPRQYLSDYYCRKCGKIFYPYPDHRYKDKRGMYCSWTCFNHRNDGVPPPMYREVEMLDMNNGEVLKIFPSLRAAADYVIGDDHSIGDACRAAKRNNKKLYTRYGYAWRYAEDHPDEDDDI